MPKLTRWRLKQPLLRVQASEQDMQVGAFPVLKVSGMGSFLHDCASCILPESRFACSTGLRCRGSNADFIMSHICLLRT